MLADYMRDCKVQAAVIGDWKNLSVDELANKYCDYVDGGDEYMSNAYFSAIMLRFWSNIPKMSAACQNISGNSLDECGSKISEIVLIALNSRAWKDSDKKLNAQQCIQQMINTRGVPFEQYNAALQKRSLNNGIISLDGPANLVDGSSDDAEMTLLDVVEDEFNIIDKIDAESAAHCFIQDYINKDKLIEAIIFDTIAYNDVERFTKETKYQISESGEKTKYVEHMMEFWESKCVKALANLPDNYSEYFTNRYVVNSDAFAAALDCIKSANNTKLYRQLRKTLSKCKSVMGDKNVLGPAV